MTDGRHESRDTDAAERLVTAVEAARLLGVSERTVRRRIAAGTLPSVKVGTSRLVPVTALTLSPGNDSADTPDATVRHDVMVPAAATTTDAAPLVELVERQAREIARLSADLAVANERLRVLGAGDEARQDGLRTRQNGPQRAEPPASASDASAPWWRFWERRR